MNQLTKVFLQMQKKHVFLDKKVAEMCHKYIAINCLALLEPEKPRHCNEIETIVKILYFGDDCSSTSNGDGVIE